MDDTNHGDSALIRMACWSDLGRIILSAAVITGLMGCPDTRPPRNPPTVPQPKMAPGAAPAQPEAAPPAAPSRPSPARE